ncbi:MAG: hypothetical protein P0120_01870 [Nitrospira sp.]|nr:hypothetical protein [Nitrospira sp.]
MVRYIAQCGSCRNALRSCWIVRFHRRLVSFIRPVLPPFLDRVEIRNLSVGTARLDLVLDRHENEVALRVARRTGEVEVVLTV